MNASSNASVGKLRKHPCGALGSRKQQRLAAGGLARGARGEVGLRGSETEHGEEHSNEFSPQKAEPILVQPGFSCGELGSTAGGEKQRTPE